jgi:hypothetical protein
MRRNRASLLLNYVFIAGLLLLALNDHFLKDAFGNLLTGKLSDFAGVLILPIFLAYVFNTRSRGVIVATVLFFTFWKSPLSQGLIDGINATGLVHYGRVVDYTDLLAFAVLPLSWLVVRFPESFALHLRSAPTITKYGILPLALVFFVATSQEDDLPFLDSGIETCCINGFNLDTISTGRVYIPSAFTPDADGINDLFRVIVDAGIEQIDTLEIIDLTSRNTVFLALNISRDASGSTGWDGSELGVTEARQIEYKVWVTATDGERRRYSGLACSIPCRTPTGLPRPAGIEECRFSNQVDAAGFFDEDVFSGELLDCFE